jgi:hypothetical protein
MNNNGEIKLNTPMGKFLYNIAKNPKYFSYVETGSCRGNGSTYCIIKGLLERNDNSILYGYETNKNFFNDAILNTETIDKNRVKIINKSLVSYDELPDWKSFNNVKKEDYKYNKDLIICDVEETYDSIDVLLLDAGGWSRQAEWNKYKNKTKVIIIDDTLGSTTHIRNEILNDKSWKLLEDNTNDRCGWLAAERV